MSASSTPTDRPRRGQRGGQVHRHRGLADAALAGGHRVHPGARAGLRERDLVGRRVAAQLLAQLAALGVAHHAELDLHRPTRPRHPRHGGGDVAGELLLHRAAGHGQQHPHGDRAAAADRHRLDHVQLGDRLADLRVVDRRQGGADRRTRRICSRRSGHDCRWYVGSPPISDRDGRPRPACARRTGGSGSGAAFLRAHAAVTRELERELAEVGHAARLVRRAAPARRGAGTGGCGWPSSPTGCCCPAPG